MDIALDIHRFHFAFTVTFHYLFVQLTLGLALLIFVLKTMALRTGNEHYNQAARFWTKIFAVNFALGVVTGIPMEFQFGTNWARFAKAAGGVIGHTLAMEGLYAFFLESSFLGLLLYGEKILGPVGHWVASLAVWIGSWISAYLIVATNAWMQRPTGYRLGPKGEILLDSWWSLVFNDWAFWQYAHTIIGGVITGAFIMSGVGALYLLLKRHEEFARTFLRLGVTAGVIASILALFPTGDQQGMLVARHQPATLAAMEAHFRTGEAAPMFILGQPNVEKQKIDNPFLVPGMLSFITSKRWDAEVKGLDAFPQDEWPTNIPLLYYAFHIMVGLGTIFIAVMTVSFIQLRRNRLYESKPLLWVLLLAAPLPYVANTAGWMTAELGRQPWLIYGLMKTAEGSSAHVSSGNAMFTLLGFMGMYTLLLMLGLFLIWRELDHGPGAEAAAAGSAVQTPAPATGD
ncbi:MAG: cytochrome ubiquinol oxidase subunit I [Bryobacteraceae bacterium]|nr:MAG: cytochrome ubiquinol oxidase subunit I [Bryobacteraceae bacterium]